MPCEMCGKEAPLKTAIIEGTEMKVCPDCLEYGHEKTETEEVTNRSKVAKGMKKRAERNKQRDVYEDHPEVLAEEFGERVMKARQKADLTIEELSDQLNEKRSVISKTEAGDHHPSDQLVKKLERKLDIELMVKQEATHRQKAGGSGGGQGSGPVTLGDLLKEQMDED